MTAVRNRAARQYVRKLMKNLPCEGQQKWRITAEVTAMLSEYIDDYPDADQEALQANFGTPEELIQELFLEPRKEPIEPKRCNKWGWIFCIVAMCIAIGFGARCIWLQHQWSVLTEDSLTDGGAEIESNALDTWDDWNRLPPEERNGAKYDLNYVMGLDGEVVHAADENGNKVEVNRWGKPLQKDYPVSEWYLEVEKHFNDAEKRSK